METLASLFLVLLVPPNLFFNFLRSKFSVLIFFFFCFLCGQEHPELYVCGILRQLYSHRRFWVLMADTVWQSLCLFFVPVLAYRGGAGLFELGAVMYTAAVFMVNLHLALEVQHWNWISTLSIVGSLVLFLASTLAYAAVVAVPDYWVFYHTYGTAQCWVAVLLTLVVGLLPRLVVLVAIQAAAPSDIARARRAVAHGHARFARDAEAYQRARQAARHHAQGSILQVITESSEV